MDGCEHEPYISAPCELVGLSERKHRGRIEAMPWRLHFWMEGTELGEDHLANRQQQQQQQQQQSSWRELVQLDAWH